MSLQIGSALRYGFDRLFERNGLLLIVLFAVVGIVGVAANQTLAAAAVEYITTLPEMQNDPEFSELVRQAETLQNEPLVVPGGVAAAVGLWVVNYVLTEVLRLMADRTFVSDRVDSLYQPTRHLGAALVSSIAATLVVFGGFLLAFVVLVLAGFVLPPTLAGVGILIGSLALFTLGIYVALGVYVFRQEIAVFDKGPLEALSDSWALTEGERLQLLGFAVALLVIGVVVTQVASLLAIAGSLVGLVGTFVAGAVVAVFSSASVAGAYRQLLGSKRPDAEFALSSFADPYDDIGEEWR